MRTVTAASLKVESKVGDEERVETHEIAITNPESLSAIRDDVHRALAEHLLGDADLDLPGFDSVWRRIEARLTEAAS